MAYPELEISYLLGCLKRGVYDNRPEARLRRHLLLYWERGFYKTSMIAAFLKQGSPSLEMTMQEKYNADLPSYLFISGDYRQARLRGSVSMHGKLLLPLIQRPHFIVSPELMTMLGGGGDEKASMVNFMCEVLEEGIGRVGLVSMGNAKVSDDTRETMRKRGIIFNKEESTMFYTVEGTFMAASRPLGKTDVRYLSRSGFLDRLFVLRWLHDRKEFDEQWQWVPQETPKESLLKQMNTRIWRALQVNHVNYPPTDYVKDCMQTLNTKYNDIEKTNGLPYFLLRSARDATNIAQMLTAMALCREIVDNGLTLYTINYEKEDVDEVKYLLDDYAESRYKQAMETEEISEKYLTQWKFYNQIKLAFDSWQNLPTLEEVRNEIQRSTGDKESAAYKQVQRWASKGWVKLEVPVVRVKNSKSVRFLK
jgi:hypothetical protein